MEPPYPLELIQRVPATELEHISQRLEKLFLSQLVFTPKQFLSFLALLMAVLAIQVTSLLWVESLSDQAVNSICVLMLTTAFAVLFMLWNHIIQLIKRGRAAVDQIIAQEINPQLSGHGLQVCRCTPTAWGIDPRNILEWILVDETPVYSTISTTSNGR